MRAFTLTLTFFVLEIFAIINAYYFNLKGATIDAERFQDRAVEWMLHGKLEFVVNAEFYIQMLGIIYTVFGPSEFIATQFGLLALLFSVLYLDKIVKLLGFNTPIWVYPLYLLWPSILFRVTTTMREPFIILTMIAMCYYVLAYRKNEKARDLFWCLFFGFIGFCFHKAYTVLLVFVTVYFAFFVMRISGNYIQSKVFYLRTLVVFGGLIGITFIVSNYSSVKGLATFIAVSSGDVEYISNVLDYKSNRDFRTTYGVALDLTSIGGFLLSVPKVFTYYMFSPFPWAVRNTLDAAASIESLFRLVSLVMALYLVKTHEYFRKYYLPILVLVLALCFIWSAGTSNYGTASRHHITTNWFFIITVAIFLKTKSASRQL